MTGFGFYCGWGGARERFPCTGWDLHGLNFPSSTKGRGVHTFSSACPDVKQKGERKVEVESRQWSNIKNGGRLFIPVKLSCGATLSLPISCAKDKISFLGDRVCFRLVDCNDFYLHNKIKIFPNS